MRDRNSKYFATAELMDRALIEILAQKDLEYVTVKDICRRAGVGRSTFYLHYRTIGDLLDEAAEHVCARFLACFGEDKEGFPERIATAPLPELILMTEEYLMPYLKFVKDNQAVMKACMLNPAGLQANGRMQELAEQVLDPIMARFGIPQSRRPYYRTYYIGGAVGVVSRWVQGGCPEPEEEICDILLGCVRPLQGRSESGHAQR